MNGDNVDNSSYDEHEKERQMQDMPPGKKSEIKGELAGFPQTVEIIAQV
jgi:hypothetical protein